MTIVIYTKSGCPNCTTAKQLLKAKGLKYSEMHQDGDDIEFNLMLKMHPEARQMPQIFAGDVRLGGLAGLQAWLQVGGGA